MPDKGLCPVCGVPRRLTAEHEWSSGGTIVQRKNPEHRMVFIETENVNRTFSGVEEIIETSIERIIVEAKRRATFDFIDHTLPGIVKGIIRVIGLRPVIRNISSLGRVMGYGDISLVSVRRVHGKGDHVTLRIVEPYSLPLFCGDLAGAFNAVNRRQVAVHYRPIDGNDYEVTGHVSMHPLELQDRLKIRHYEHKPGDIALEPCPDCGGPLALADFAWDLDRGVVVHRERGRRMAMLGPAALDAIIDDLEDELGETIPHVIVEAQKRFIKTGFYGLDEITPSELLRKQLAIRGMGNLRNMEWVEDNLRVCLENACLHPVIAGLILGFFEFASGREGSVSWNGKPDGDLEVEVAAAG